jgi:hypothetical protein
MDENFTRSIGVCAHYKTHIDKQKFSSKTKEKCEKHSDEKIK